MKPEDIIERAEKAEAIVAACCEVFDCRPSEAAQKARELKAELDAMKEALRNPTDDMVASGLLAARDTGEITEVFKAMTAHLLKD